MKQHCAPLLLTVAQVAALMQVDRHVVYRLLATGELAHVKLGARRTRIPREAMERWIGARVGVQNKNQVSCDRA